MSLTEIKSFMGYPINEDGDIEGAIPVFEVHQQVQNAMKQFTENQNNIILEYCYKLKIDPNVLEKQLKEIQMLKVIIEQKDKQIEKMKNVGNCKKAMLCAEWNEKQCILGQMRFCLNCDKWEMAE